MKLIYQHMLSFLLIIIATVSIIGYAEVNYVRNQAYEQNFERMESYGNTIGELAMTAGKGEKAVLNNTFLGQLQFVLSSNHVHFRVFTPDNNQVYPQTSESVRLPRAVFNSLKKGQEIRIKNNKVETHIWQTKNAYSGVLMPWFSNHRLMGVIWIGSTVHNIERPIQMAKANLLNALIITLLVGVFLSFILSYYSTSKIKRLSKATDKVAAGDFDVQIKHKDHDEIDQLATNFNRMVRKLKKSNDEIKAQEKRRDQFMADAAHEMRTPLTTINGILEGLQYDAIPEESKPKSIALMRRETTRLIRLINENLDYEKIRNNQIMLIKTNFDAKKVLQDIVVQLQNNAEKAKDELILKAPSNLPIYADRDRFTQIIVNLVQNAIQFTHDGKITISAKRLEHACQIQVSDNGIGMSKEQIKYIFERFFKADTSRARLGTGESGLGLSIVSSLIKQHGGKITVDSTPKVGSTFIVTIYDKGFEQFVSKS